MKVISITLAFILVSATLSTEFTVVNELSMIDTVNNKGTTWIAGPNSRFENVDLESFKNLLGAFPQESSPFQLPVKNVIVADNLPTNFDPRIKWSYCESLNELRDQSNCGSCWAFGAAEAMSDRICIASKGKYQTRISSENILSCCSSCGMGCNGGWPAQAWAYFQNTGIVTGDLYGDSKTCQPYTFPPCDHHVKGKYGPCKGGEYPTPNCKTNCQSGYKKSYENDKWYAASSYQVPSDEQSIMTELITHGSVEGAFSVYADFPTYKSGVYQHVSGDLLGGHAIKIMGWGVENGVKYWLCANSWNEGWGDKGFFKILRGSNHCGIEAGVVAGIPKIPEEEFLHLIEDTR